MQQTCSKEASTGHAITIVLLGLFLSGVASIVNQVAWQRALKVFLGGSESISSLVVVMVFMLGLGGGAVLMSRRAERIENPIRVFSWLEISLFVVNICVAVLLSSDISDSVYAVQRFAVSAGVPLRAVYALGALLVLLLPTVLMGATLPIASEGCQRQLGATESSLITRLFFVNTIGAVIGAAGCSFFLLPVFGQRVSLVSAAVFNLAAGLVVTMLARRTPAPARKYERALAGLPPQNPWLRLSLAETLGMGLGFLSLGYEMYLLRLMQLLHKPLPYTFAATLCLFLLFWSIGVFAAPRVVDRIRATFIAAVILIATVPVFYHFDRWQVKFSMFGGGLYYFLPCICFGLLYGALIARSAQHWGNDVGRFYGFNTFGSCLGIGFFTLAGYEINHDYNAILIALGLVGLLFHFLSNDPPAEGEGQPAPLRLKRAAIATAMVGVFVFGWLSPYSERRGERTYWGRDGVVEIQENGDIIIDGLWHSKLSDGINHVGRVYTWLMAVAGVLAHGGERIEQALVIGNGVGMTSGTLAKLNGIQIDTYEINQTLKSVLDDYPTETLGVATNPEIDIRWQDARSGVALDPKTYDLIISAPLHLKQAGSSILLSQEYLRLLKSRLKENGVLVIYSHEGIPVQSLLVGRTVRTVFAYAETFKGGLLTVASNTPIEINPASIAAKLERPDPLYREIASFDRFLRSKTGSSIYDSFDSKPRRYPKGRYLITDDHPLLEYPAIADRIVR